MKTIKIILFLLLILFLFGALIPQALSAEIANEAFTSSGIASESTIKTGISGATGGPMIYTSSLLSRVVSDNPLVPFETSYSIDIASADPEQPVSAIVSTLFTAKGSTVLQNELNTTISTAEIADRAKIAGQINRIMKEFGYTFSLISTK